MRLNVVRNFEIRVEFRKSSKCSGSTFFHPDAKNVRVTNFWKILCQVLLCQGTKEYSKIHHLENDCMFSKSCHFGIWYFENITIFESCSFLSDIFSKWSISRWPIVQIDFKSLFQLTQKISSILKIPFFIFSLKTSFQKSSMTSSAKMRFKIKSSIIIPFFVRIFIWFFLLNRREIDDNIEFLVFFCWGNIVLSNKYSNNLKDMYFSFPNSKISYLWIRPI